jgi:hypothetical protein
MLPCHYYVNVAELTTYDKCYHHLFNTDTQCQNQEAAAYLFRTIKEKFPEPRYKVTLSHVTCYVQNCDEDGSYMGRTAK